jgi:hypothetical protein
VSAASTGRRGRRVDGLGELGTGPEARPPVGGHGDQLPGLPAPDGPHPPRPDPADVEGAEAGQDHRVALPQGVGERRQDGVERPAPVRVRGAQLRGRASGEVAPAQVVRHGCHLPRARPGARPHGSPHGSLARGPGLRHAGVMPRGRWRQAPAASGGRRPGLRGAGPGGATGADAPRGGGRCVLELPDPTADALPDDARRRWTLGAAPRPSRLRSPRRRGGAGAP